MVSARLVYLLAIESTSNKLTFYLAERERERRRKMSKRRGNKER